MINYVIIYIRFLYQKINYISNNNILNLFLLGLKINFIFKNKTNRKYYINVKTIQHNLIFKSSHNLVANNLTFLNFDFECKFLIHYLSIKYFYKVYFFNNFFLNSLNLSFYYHNWSNHFLNYFYIFNCFFYNFYNDNMFLYFKFINNNKNHFYWFLIRFFKKKRKKRKKKKKLKKRKKKFFRFRRRRFKFKRLRKHYKVFRFKKKRKKKDNLVDLNFAYYYNFISKITRIKKFKYKNEFTPVLLNISFEAVFLKKKSSLLNTSLINDSIVNNYPSLVKTESNLSNYKCFKFLKYFKFLKNIKYLRFNLISHKFKRFKFNKFKIYTFIKKTINYFNYGVYFNILNQLYIFYTLFFLKGFYKTIFIRKIRSIKRKKFKTKKWKKRRHSFKSKFFKRKKKYRYKSRFIFQRKLDMKRSKKVLKKGFYKLLFMKLIRSFRFKHNYFVFSNLNKYNFYLFSKLKQNKNFLKKFFKKKFIFFNFMTKHTNNSGLIYNNHTPVYTTSKATIKKFRKIFKSKFTKKFNNYIYYYVIFFFEKFLNKKIVIKSLNLNAFKKKKYKKIFFFRKLVKIFKKNKFLVISRSVKFNLAELLEIVLHSFYKKDVYPLINWFIRNFKPVHFTRHKNFLTFFKIVLNDVFESYKDVFKVKGFFFILRGKIGVTSNAKRKTVKFVLGSLNKSNRSQKMDFQQNVVKSLSGSLGISLILSY